MQKTNGKLENEDLKAGKIRWDTSYSGESGCGES